MGGFVTSKSGHWMELVSPSTAWQSFGANIRCWIRRKVEKVEPCLSIWTNAYQSVSVLSSIYLPFTAFISLHLTTNLDFHPKPMSISDIGRFLFLMFCFQHVPTKEFLWSDVCYLADQGATPLSLCQVIAATPIQVAQLANRELPIRFAKRIRQIEAPDAVDEVLDVWR